MGDATSLKFFFQLPCHNAPPKHTSGDGNSLDLRRPLANSLRIQVGPGPIPLKRRSRITQNLVSFAFAGGTTLWLHWKRLAAGF